MTLLIHRQNPSLITAILLAIVACSSNVRQGNDVYYEYSTSMTHKSFVFKGTNKIYLSSNGKITTITDSQDPFFSWHVDGHGGSIPNIEHVYHKMETEIIDINDSLHFILLKDSAKTYQMMDYPPKMNDRPLSDTSILQIVGKEIVNGFNSTHVCLTTTEEYNGERKIIETRDIWFSKQVPTPVRFSKRFEQILGSDVYDDYSQTIKKQLEKEGCTGIVVRMTSDTGAWMTVYNLAKATYISAPDSLFSVPSSYKLEEKVSYD